MSRQSEDIILSDYERGFLEGVIDTDGLIALYKHRRSFLIGLRGSGKGYTWMALVVIGNTCKKLLEKVKGICGNRGRITYRKSDAKRKAFYEYHMPVSVQRIVLPQLRLVVKEEQRLLFLDALEYLKNQRGIAYSIYDVYLEQIEKDIKEAKRK